MDINPKATEARARAEALAELKILERKCYGPTRSRQTKAAACALVAEKALAAAAMTKGLLAGSLRAKATTFKRLADQYLEPAAAPDPLAWNCQSYYD